VCLVLVLTALQCQFGESWVVCGNDEDLGMWDPDKSLELKVDETK
jgi:hypothetical protein